MLSVIPGLPPTQEAGLFALCKVLADPKKAASRMEELTAAAADANAKLIALRDAGKSHGERESGITARESDAAAREADLTKKLADLQALSNAMDDELAAFQGEQKRVAEAAATTDAALKAREAAVAKVEADAKKREADAIAIRDEAAAIKADYEARIANLTALASGRG